MEQTMTFVESDYNKLEENVLSVVEQGLKAINIAQPSLMPFLTLLTDSIMAFILLSDCLICFPYLKFQTFCF